MWQEVSEIYLQDSEFCEMKRLDLEYRKLIKSLLSDNRIKQIIEVQQHIFENMNGNSSSDNEELPSLLSLSSAGNEVQKCLAIHQIHYWMSEIQHKREEMFNFMKRVQDNTKHSKVLEVSKNKVVVIQRIDTIAEIDILQEWHNLFLSKYKDKPEDNFNSFMYNDKRLFLIQDLVDQYYPISDNKANNNKWLRVAKIRLRNSEFNEMKRLIFEYRQLMNLLMSNRKIKHLLQLQNNIVNYINSSDDESHLLLTSQNESQRKNLEDIRNLLSKIKEKWEEMYLLLQHITDVSRTDEATDKLLVLTQRVDTTADIDNLRLWHDFLVSACGGNNRPNDDSKIMDHFLIQELIDRYYPNEFVCDEPQFRILVTSESQSQLEDTGVILLEENDNGIDDSDDDEEREEDGDQEREEIELEQQIQRVEELRKLDKKREFLEHFKELLKNKLKNNEGELKQLLKLRQEQYQRHGLTETVNQNKGFHDTFIIKPLTPMQRGIYDRLPMRLQLFYKIIENKTKQTQPNINNQQQNSSTSKFDDLEPSNSINNRESIFRLMRYKNMFRGSAHWWVHFGLERRISPLITKVSLDIQTRPMVTVPFVNQLQLTKPQTRTRVAQVIVNEQIPIAPIIPTYDQEKELWEYIVTSFLGLIICAEGEWLQKLQIKYSLYRVESEQHWKVALRKKQKQVELLLKSVDYALQQQRDDKVNQEQNQTQNAHLQKPSASTSVICVEHGTYVHKQWHLLEAERKSHEQQWKTKRFEYFEMKNTNRLFFREIFSRLKNYLASKDDRGLLSIIKGIAFEHFSNNFRPLNEAEREKLGQEMLNPNSLEGESHDEYYQRVQNISEENESKEQDSQFQDDQQFEAFKLEQLHDLILNQKVPNIQKLRSMQPDVIKQLLQEQSDQIYQKEQNEKLLKYQIYKYKQTQSEQEKKEKEQNKLSRETFQNVVLLHYNQRIILLQQLNRVKKQLSETHDHHQGQTSQALSSSTQQMAMTSVILVPQPTISKQQSSKSSVMLTPHEPLTLKQHSSASLIPHNISTSVQSSIVTVRPQPVISSDIQPNRPWCIPPSLKILKETQKCLEQRLNLVDRKLTPLMKLWDLTLYFPECYLHKELDDIVENRLIDLGVDIRKGLESVSQQLQEIGNFDGRIGFMKMTEITMQRFERLQLILDYLHFQRHQLYHLIGESTILTYHGRPVIPTGQSSWGTQQPKYSMSINLEKGLMKKDSMYSMSMTFQQPLTFLQNFASPLIHLPDELPMFEQEQATHSLLLKLKRPFTEIQKSSQYSASMILLQPCMSNQITSVDSNLIETQQTLISKQQSPSSSVILIQQQPSTSKYNLSSSQTVQTLQKKQLPISSVSPTVISKSIATNSKIINNHLNKNREKRRLSSGDENENCGKRLKSTFRKKHTTSSLEINRKRRRQISISHQTKKPTSSVFHDDKGTDDCVIISDSNDDHETSESSSESSLECSIHNPATSMTVQMSEKSPLTIKLIRVKPSPPVDITSSNNSEEKSMKDHSQISTNNLNDNQNNINKEKTKVERKNIEKKIKKDAKNNKNVKQKISENVDLKETNLYKENEDCEMETTIEKENIVKKYPVIDHRVPTSTVHTALINQPSQVSIIVNRPTEIETVVADKPIKEIISMKKPIKVALVESAPLMTSVVDGKKIKVMPKYIKPVNMVCTINEPQRKDCVDHTMGVIKGIVDAAEKTIKKIPMALTQKPQEEIGCSPTHVTKSMEKLKTSQSIEKNQIYADTISSKNIKENLETNDNCQLTIPIHKNPIERFRNLVRTVTLDFQEPAVPIFYDHGFADGSPERMVHSRFVSTIMSMMAAHSVALRPQLVPPQRLQLLMECATKKLYSNEPLTIGGVDINEYSTLSSLLDQVISQNSTAETSLNNDARCRTSNFMINSKQAKKQVDHSTFQKYTASSSSLITRPSRLTTVKTTPIVEEVASTIIKLPICSTSTLASNNGVNSNDQPSTKRNDSIELVSTPSITMTNTSFLSQPVIGLLQKSNSTVTTTSNVTSSTEVTESSSGCNTIKRSASAVSLISSSTISNTEMTSPSLLFNLPKRSKSAVMSTTSPVTAIDTTEFIKKNNTASNYNLKRSRSGKRSTSVTTVSSLLAVGPPKRSKSAAAMTVSPSSTKTVTIHTTPIITTTKTTLAAVHKSKETSMVPTSDTSSVIIKNEPSSIEASHDCNPSESKETIITKEDMRTITVKRKLCTSVPAYMDVTTDACAFVVSACEQYIRNMVKERLSKGGRGAGTLELRRRNAFIAAMVIDDDIRPVPEYCRTVNLRAPETHPVVTDTHTNDSSLSVLEQQSFRNYITNKPKQFDVLTIGTVVETQATAVTTTSISSTINKQFPTETSSTMKTISSPLETIIGTSARTRGRQVSKKTTTPSAPVTLAKMTNESPMIDNQQLENTTIVSPNNQPLTVSSTRKRPLTVPSTSKEYIAGPSTNKPSNLMSLNSSQSKAIPSTSKLPVVVSTSTTVKQIQSTRPLAIVTDAMKNQQISTAVVATKTPPISTSKKEANLVRKSSSAFSVQRGQLVVSSAFHRRQPFGSLVTTCSKAAAEAAAVNKNAHMLSSDLAVESDDEDEDIDGWSNYLGDRELLPPISRFPLYELKTKVPVGSVTKNDTSCDSSRDKEHRVLTKILEKVHVLPQEQRPSVSRQDKEEEKKASQPQLKFNSEQQDNQGKQVEKSFSQNLYEHESKTPESLQVYHQKFLELQYGLTEKPLLDQPEIRHHQGLVSWY